MTRSFEEEGCLIAGVPAKVVRSLEPEDERMLYYKTRPDLPDMPSIDVPRAAREG